MKFRQILLALAAASQIATAAPPDTQAVEFFNLNLGHYFITADASEAVGIDGGSAGPGWTRTGRSFGAWLNPANAPAGSAAVCRFYSIGANSHFFTASAAECATLKALETTQRQEAIQFGHPFTGWIYEGIAFTAAVPAGLVAAQKAGSSCGSGTEDIFRAYNNGFASGQGANHRFVNDSALRDLMEDRGWTPEGVAFCAPVQSSGTSAPAAPSTGSYPELAASWTGQSHWEFNVRPGGPRSETHAVLTIAIADAGNITGNGNGCTLAGAVTQVDGFRVFYTGTMDAAACADGRFNGSYPLRIERLGSGQLQFHFGQETATSEIEVEALLSTASVPPPSPPPATGGVNWVGTAAWISTQRTGGTQTIIASVNQPLSLTLVGTALTGTGFGCTLAGTVQAGAGGAMSGTLTAAGCSEPSFNGGYTQVDLQPESGIALEVEFEKETQAGQTTAKATIRGVLFGQNGTPIPTPPPGTPPATSGSWSGAALFQAELRQNGNSTILTSIQETLALTLSGGALSGTGFGCTFAGTMQAAANGLIGTVTATGCTDAKFSGTYAGVSIHDEDNGAIQIEFEKETSSAQGNIKVTIVGTLPAGSGTIIAPPPAPPATGFVLAGTWGANDVEWTVETRQGGNPEQTTASAHALSLTISSNNGVTGSGFGCSFTGSIQQPLASEPVFLASLQASGCSNPAFNGSYSDAGLHADNGALQIEVEREIEGGGLRTKVRIEGVLRK